MKASEIMHTTQVRPNLRDPVLQPPADAEFTGRYGPKGDPIWVHTRTESTSEILRDERGDIIWKLNGKGERIGPRRKRVDTQVTREFIVVPTSPGCNVLNYHFKEDPEEQARIDRRAAIAQAQRDLAEALVDTGMSATDFVRQAAAARSRVADPPKRESTPPAPPPAETKPPGSPMSYREFVSYAMKEKGMSMAEAAVPWHEYKKEHGL